MLKNLSESFDPSAWLRLDYAQNQRWGLDSVDDFSVLLSLKKHEALEAFRTFFQQPARGLKSSTDVLPVPVGPKSNIPTCLLFDRNTSGLCVMDSVVTRDKASCGN